MKRSRKKSWAKESEIRHTKVRNIFFYWGISSVVLLEQNDALGGGKDGAYREFKQLSTRGGLCFWKDLRKSAWLNWIKEASYPFYGPVYLGRNVLPLVQQRCVLYLLRTRSEMWTARKTREDRVNSQVGARPRQPLLAWWVETQSGLALHQVHVQGKSQKK